MCPPAIEKLLTYDVLKRRRTNTPRRRRLADSQHSSLYSPSPSCSSFGATSVMLCCSPPPTTSSTPLRPSVYYPSIGLVVNSKARTLWCSLSDPTSRYPSTNATYVSRTSCFDVKEPTAKLLGKQPGIPLPPWPSIQDTFGHFATI